LRASGISEAFLARLEAGLLAHPFRGVVRRRVLALAWLLCKSQQEVRTYLSASEVMDLSAAEVARLGQLRAQLATPQRAFPCFLPPLSPLLIGREAMVEEVLKAITTGLSGLYAITGMPGVGKSVLPAAVMPRVGEEGHLRSRYFPDGILYLTAAGCDDTAGAMVLLNEIASIVEPEPAADGKQRQSEPRRTTWSSNAVPAT